MEIVKISLCIVLILIMGSCDTSTNNEQNYSISIKTQSNIYSIQNFETIIITIKNNSKEYIYLPIDSTFTLQKLANNNWIDNIWSIHRIGVYKTFSLLQGMIREETMEPGFIPGKGTYRFKFLIYEDNELTKILPDNLLYSNTFENRE